MKKLNKLLVYIALATLPMLFSHCTLTEDLTKLKTSLDSVKIAIGTPKFSTMVRIEFVDEATNLPITDKEVKVSVSGKDSALLFNNMGARLNQYTAKWGMLNLVVDPHIDANALSKNPVDFVITPSLAGYIGSPQRVFLLNSGTNSVTVRMINISAPPAGYYNSGDVTVGSTNSNGQIGGSTTINLAPRRNIRSNSTLTDYAFSFLDGTTLLDKTGKILIGSITTNFIRHEYNTDYPWIIWNGNGFVSITKYLDASFQFFVTPDGGVKTPVAKFGNSGGILFTTPVPVGFVNDQTNAPFNVGEKIERWESRLLYFNPTNSLTSTKHSISQVNAVKVVQDTLKNMSDYLQYTYGSSLPAVAYNTDMVLKGKVSAPNTMVRCDVISNYKLINQKYFDFYNPTGNKVLSINGVATAGKSLQFRLAASNPESNHLLFFR